MDNHKIEEAAKAIIGNSDREATHKIGEPNAEPKVIDWEQRRYEIAKAAMFGLMAGHNSIYDAPRLAHVAKQYANALIKELKKGRNNEND